MNESKYKKFNVNQMLTQLEILLDSYEFDNETIELMKKLRKKLM